MLIALAPLLLSGAAPADDCAALAQLASPILQIVSAARDGSVCHVEAVARPRPTANIGVSLWLPLASRWSGRYYQMGNGGFAGTIDRATLAAAAARGDVAAATDTGHQGTRFDASWARGRPDLVRDYAFASIKTTADTAAALTTAYYGKRAGRRYFMGCSFGGRQALVAASRWPRDWDGIIAGAPAVRWIDWLTGLAAVQHQLRATPDGWIAPERFADLRHPSRLTAGQRRALAAIERAGYRLADADPAEWRRWILNADPSAPSQARLAAEAFRYLLRDAPGWTLADYRAGDAAPRAVSDLLAVGTLDPFLRRGGKIIAYVGTADAVLPPHAIIADLRQRFGPWRRNARLVIVPGMAHCQGGGEPHAFGQSSSAPPLRDDPDHDIRRAVEAWVERGRLPQSLIAANADGSRPTPTRRLRYDGR